MMKRRAISLLLALAWMGLAGGCAENATLSDGRLSAEVADDAITIRNWSSETAYYWIVEREALATINFAPCTRSPTCPTLAPGASTSVPKSSIAFYTPEAREAVVFWWGKDERHMASTVVKLR